MKSLMETDIFAQSAKSFNIERKIRNMISGDSGTIITYEDMSQHIQNTMRIFKDASFVNAVENFKNGNIILVYYKDMKESLPPFLPYVKFAKNGEKKIMIDMSYTLSEHDGIYNVRQLESFYALLVCANMYLELFDKKSSLPATTLSICAEMWAKMYCKVLNRLIALHINKERYDAFIYFAMQYFCRYILETPDVIANSVAEKYLPNGKSILINNIESRVNSEQLDIYGSFQNFCNVMFNNEITGVRSGLKGSTEEVNYTTYLSAFMREFDKSSLYGLAAFPYFLLMIYRVNIASRDINRRALEEIMLDPKKFMLITKDLSKDLK